MYHTLDGTNLLNQNIYNNANSLITTGSPDSVSNSPSSARDREYSGAANADIPFQLADAGR